MFDHMDPHILAIFPNYMRAYVLKLFATTSVGLTHLDFLFFCSIIVFVGSFGSFSLLWARFLFLCSKDFPF